MIRKILNNLAGNPVLFEIFERIFGADKQKRDIYRMAYQNNMKLLDFGCSTGNTTEAFLDFEYYGIDQDIACIKYAKNRWKSLPNVKFFAKDIFKRPFKKNFFDYVLFAGTGHHIPEHLIKPILVELLHVLKPGGELWFYDILRPQKNSPLFAKILAKLDRGIYIRSMSEYERLFKNFKGIKTTEKKKIKVTGTLVPQEDYCFFRIQKI